MRIWLSLFVAAASLVWGPLIAPAMAQTQAQQDRVDLISRYVVTAPMCERLGMTLDSELPSKAAAAFEEETSSWSVDRAVVEKLILASIGRQGNLLKIDLEAASNDAKTEADLRQLRTILLGYGHTCMNAASDPVFSGIIRVPANYNLDKAATDLADSMLEKGGLASWQTPAIQARGDLMMIAGACRKVIGKSRSDSLVAEFGKSDDPHVRSYYLQSFDDGLNDTDLSFDLGQCDGLVARYRKIIESGKE